MKRAVNRTQCTDIFEILVCVRIINRLNASQRIKNNSKISANMRNAILRYSDIKFHKTMIDQKNISIFNMFANKRLIRSIIKSRIHTHEHV